MIKEKIFIYTFYRFKNFTNIKAIKLKLDKSLKDNIPSAKEKFE